MCVLRGICRSLVRCLLRGTVSLRRVGPARVVAGEHTLLPPRYSGPVCQVQRYDAKRLITLYRALPSDRSTQTTTCAFPPHSDDAFHSGGIANHNNSQQPPSTTKPIPTPIYNNTHKRQSPQQKNLEANQRELLHRDHHCETRFRARMAVSMTTVQKRHAPRGSPSKHPSLASASELPQQQLFEEASPASLNYRAPAKRRRRRRRRPGTWGGILSPKSFLGPKGRVAMAMVLILLVIGAVARVGWSVSRWMLERDESSGSSTMVSVETAAPEFQLYSERAPECKTLVAPEQISFTLVTQLSQDRLWMMEHHCRRFPHHISIAVYTNQTHLETERELEKMGCRLGKRLRLNVLDSRTVSSHAEYPVNRLRNLALAGVKTSHFIYIDVDFWTSENLYETLTAPSVRQALLEDPKLALVIPAFMLFRQCLDYRECPEYNVPMMPFSKEDIVDMIKHKRGHVFDPTNRGGHGSTRYMDWIKQKDSDLLPIDCLISHRYEPFVAVRYCRDLPPFQDRFEGYGKNKMTWMMQVVRRGYLLSQVGGAFLVHYPHLDSKARQEWNKAPDELKVPISAAKQKRKEARRQQQRENGEEEEPDGPQYQLRKPKSSDGNLHLAGFKRGKIDKLFVEFRDWLEENVADISRLGLCESAQDDDTKLWIDHENNQNNAEEEEEEEEESGDDGEEEEDDMNEQEEEEEDDKSDTEEQDARAKGEDSSSETDPHAHEDIMAAKI